MTDHYSEPLIHLLSRLVDGRDIETAGHVERVSEYSMILADRMRQMRKFRGQIDDLFISRMGWAAALHDVGKEHVPEHILTKPAPLTASEAKLMRRHTTAGAQSLAKSLRYHPDSALRQMAIDIALTHHERWNGTGYPHGLAGEAIPLAGRIVALADVYDALTSKRVYKDAFTHPFARSLILRDKGSHFDPSVVDAFVASEGAMIAAAAEHATSVTAVAA